MDKLIATSLNTVNTVCQTLKTEDDVLFCKSLVSQLHGLSPQKNKKARIRIQQVLFENMMKAITNFTIFIQIKLCF